MPNVIILNLIIILIVRQLPLQGPTKGPEPKTAIEMIRDAQYATGPR